MGQSSLPTNQKIINQTITQIQESGFENISLRQLANQVGLTTGAFYKSFSSKETLFAEVTQILSTRLAKQISQQIDPTSSPQDQLLSIADKLMQRFQSDAHTMTFLFFNPSAKKVLNSTNETEQFDFYSLVISIIKQIKDLHPQLDPQTLFIQIWSFIQGYGLLIINDITPYDSTLVSSTLTALLKA